MRRWLPPLLLALLTAYVHHHREAVRDFLAGPEVPYSQADLAQETAALRFRQGPQTDAPRQAGQNLFLNAEVRRLRLGEELRQADVSQSTAAEWQAWHRQWEKDEERAQRLAGQGLTPPQMHSRIHETLLDQAWIEQRIADQIQVSEAELQAAFQARRQQLQIPQVHHVAHLFLTRHGAKTGDRSAELQNLRQRLMKGEKWPALVQAHSEDARTKSRAGDLGWMSAERMPADFIAAVEKLKTGETSGPVSTRLGWHLIQVLERRPARLPALDEVRTELQAELVCQKRQAALERLTKELSHSRHPGTRL